MGRIFFFLQCWSATARAAQLLQGIAPLPPSGALQHDAYSGGSGRLTTTLTAQRRCGAVSAPRCAKRRAYWYAFLLRTKQCPASQQQERLFPGHVAKTPPKNLFHLLSLSFSGYKKKKRRESQATRPSSLSLARPFFSFQHVYSYPLSHSRVIATRVVTRFALPQLLDACQKTFPRHTF